MRWSVTKKELAAGSIRNTSPPNLKGAVNGNISSRHLQFSFEHDWRIQHHFFG
jgi:hypothetical protein